jgi:hypothetical protein
MDEAELMEKGRPEEAGCRGRLQRRSQHVQRSVAGMRWMVLGGSGSVAEAPNGRCSWRCDELAVRKAGQVRGDGLPKSTGGHELSRRCRTCQNACGDRWQRCAHDRLRAAPRKDRGYQVVTWRPIRTLYLVSRSRERDALCGAHQDCDASSVKQ